VPEHGLAGDRPVGEHRPVRRDAGDAEARSHLVADRVGQVHGQRPGHDGALRWEVRWCQSCWEVGSGVSELRQVFNDLIRFEIELWNAVDARLKGEFGLPLTHVEPMSVMHRLGTAVPERTLRQFAAALRQLRTAGRGTG
jgi:hypothetical protein